MVKGCTFLTILSDILVKKNIKLTYVPLNSCPVSCSESEERVRSVLHLLVHVENAQDTAQDGFL